MVGLLAISVIENQSETKSFGRIKTPWAVCKVSGSAFLLSSAAIVKY